MPDEAARIAAKVGIGRSAALNRIAKWHPLRWYEPPQASTSGINHQRPAPKSHPWSSPSYRIKKAEKAARNRE